MKPDHYPKGELEPLKLIQRHNLPFELGNALKYIARCNHKGTKREDLQKALEYLRRYNEHQSNAPFYQFEKEWKVSQNLGMAAAYIIEKKAGMALIYLQQELDND